MTRARIAMALVAAVATGALAGCQSVRGERTSLERMRAEALAEIDQPACLARGGRIDGVGMFGMPACVEPFADARKACVDSTECEGNCMRYDDLVDAGTRVGGICQVETPEDGCFQAVEDGVAQPALCFD